MAGIQNSAFATAAPKRPTSGTERRMMSPPQLQHLPVHEKLTTSIQEHNTNALHEDTKVEPDVDTFLQEFVDGFAYEPTPVNSAIPEPGRAEPEAQPVDTGSNSEDALDCFSGESLDKVRHKLLAAAYSLHGADIGAFFDKLETIGTGCIDMQQLQDGIRTLLPQANDKQVRSLMLGADKVTLEVISS